MRLTGLAFRIRGSIVVVLVALASACVAVPGASGDVSGMVWDAGMEPGSLAEWGDGRDGGLFNSGRWRADTSVQQAHSGRYSLRTEISTPSTPLSGVRAFRWGEARENREAYYSAWYYFPAEYRVI